jgi:hypothetical protein
MNKFQRLAMIFFVAAILCGGGKALAEDAAQGALFNIKFALIGPNGALHLAVEQTIAGAPACSIKDRFKVAADDTRREQIHSFVLAALLSGRPLWIKTNGKCVNDAPAVDSLSINP